MKKTSNPAKAIKAHFMLDWWPGRGAGRREAEAEFGDVACGTGFMKTPSSVAKFLCSFGERLVLLKRVKIKSPIEILRGRV
jgi:hypothetical protein